MSQAPSDLLIRDVADLRRLTAAGPRARALRLDLPRLTPDENQRWQARLAHDYGGCGCDTGAWFMAAALLAIGGLWWWSWDAPGWGWSGRAIWSFAILFAAALTGKLAGLWVARTRLRRAVAALSALG